MRPSTWLADRYVGVIHGPLPDAISRSDLVTAIGETDWQIDADVSRVFVLVMMWGSGTRNGRGPRYTATALRSPHAVDHLRHARHLLEQGDIPAAYDVHRNVEGLGPAFHTKWLWLVGRAAGTRPQPLILDARVWASLSELRWSSLAAAGGDRRGGHRYLAYLQACERWAQRHGCSPEDVEHTLWARS